MQSISLTLCKPTLALGADTNSAVAFIRRTKCEITDPIGDLAYVENFEKFTTTIEDLPQPKIIASDLHPGYFSYEFANKLAKQYGAKVIRIQHHKAHLAAAAVEHDLKEYLGIVCDGLGYGDDNTLWGGEVFHVKDHCYNRIGHLEEQKQIGGDSAAIYPKKMLFSILKKLNTDLTQWYTAKESSIYNKQLELNYNVYLTTSTGRILDAVSALLGVSQKRTYDGEPAIELEKFATDPYDLEPVINNNILNTTEMFRFLLENMNKDKKRLGATAQMYIAKGMYQIAAQYHLPIIFTGGVAYNKMISGYMEKKGVLLNKNIAPGDAGISVGQIILANHAMNEAINSPT